MRRRARCTPSVAGTTEVNRAELSSTPERMPVTRTGDGFWRRFRAEQRARRRRGTIERQIDMRALERRFARAPRCAECREAMSSQRSTKRFCSVACRVAHHRRTAT
jgi:hypothetical protein